MTASTDTGRITAAIADQIADPHALHPRPADPPWWRQSLALGGVAVALLHTHRASADLAPWQRAEQWLRYVTAGPIDDGPDSHLHYGAPALAFVLTTAAAQRPGRCERVLAVLDRRITTATRRRLDEAHRRIDGGDLPALAEFDAIRGLTGLGALWLRRDPNGNLIRDILTYLVRLTEPVQHGDDTLPSWWTALAPSGRRCAEFPDGHANNGVAHGIGGPLALLALAARHGVRIPGQDNAIIRICAWLDRWQRQSPSGDWWPYWITGVELRSGRSTRHSPGRPSWCYGTAGLARAQQLAGIALADRARQRRAEDVLLAVVSDPDLPRTLHDASVCHGLAGILHITARAAHDSLGTALPEQLAALRDTVLSDERVTAVAEPSSTGSGNLGLLEGAAGIALALDTTTTTAHISGWDACLLTS